jgi:hypothetical protein
MAATQGNQVRESMIAGADLSAKQFTFVIGNTTDRTVVSAGDGAAADGVLINQPLSGNAATVVTHGRVIVEVGTGGLTAGDEVAVDANGEAVAAATAGDIVVGKCVDGAAAGERATIDFFRGGNAVPA